MAWPLRVGPIFGEPGWALCGAVAVGRGFVGFLSGVSAFAVLAVVLWLAPPAAANVALLKVSSDSYTNSSSQHRTEVEPDTFAFGSTIVSVFQVGRIFGGRSANIGFATSNNSGGTWVGGFLPGITVNQGDPFAAASDPSVAFDARHGVWLISSLVLNFSGAAGVVTSCSTDAGRSWDNPVTTATDATDKNCPRATACNTSSSVSGARLPSTSEIRILLSAGAPQSSS